MSCFSSAEQNSKLLHYEIHNTLDNVFEIVPINIAYYILLASLTPAYLVNEV